jgi:hypothetical protein
MAGASQKVHIKNRCVSAVFFELFEKEEIPSHVVLLILFEKASFTSRDRTPADSDGNVASMDT